MFAAAAKATIKEVVPRNNEIFMFYLNGVSEGIRTPNNRFHRVPIKFFRCTHH
jgi:hypothetical protein